MKNNLNNSIIKKKNNKNKIINNCFIDCNGVLFVSAANERDSS